MTTPESNIVPTEHLAARGVSSRDLAAVDPMAAPQPSTGELATLLRVVHRCLRGRYAVTVMFALLLGGAGAAVTWCKVKPVYRSEGLLRIAYTMPEVLQETDQNAPLQMFDTFMFSQRLLITSRRVIDMAVQDPIWKATGRRLPDQPDRYFAEHLDVEIKPRGEFILIGVRDEDPGTAAAAVTAVTNAYTELYSSQDKQLERQRTGVLEDRQTYLQGRVEQLTHQLASGTQAFGTADLKTFYDAAVTRVIRLQSTMSELELTLATGKTPPKSSVTAPATRPSGEEPSRTSLMTVEQIAQTDVEMRRLISERESSQDQLRRLLVLGYGESHREVIGARQALDRAQARVTNYETSYREYHRPDPAEDSVTPSEQTPDQIRSNLIRLTNLYDAAKTEMVSTGNQQLQIKRMSDELQATRDELDKLIKRAATLRTEGSLGGRLNVISSGEIPLTPERDVRGRFTVLGGLTGVLLACSTMVGLGLLRGRVLYADESSARVGESARMLGILPDLHRADAARRAAAAHAVHQIRVLLQPRAAAERHAAVHLITSSASGEGKTSFALALALSSAACGLRTLLIDADFVGRNLTTGLGGQKRVGLREALESGTLAGHTMRLRPKLRVLGTGHVRTGDASCVSAAKLGLLLSEARRDFDVVLIDSGPILGSLEAAVLASEVDRAIILIRKGQRHDLVRISLLRLRSLGVKTADFVYNRASAKDFEQSAMSSTSSSRLTSVAGVTTAQPPSATAAGNDPIGNFGPLVQAVETDLSPLNASATGAATAA